MGYWVGGIDGFYIADPSDPPSCDNAGAGGALVWTCADAWGISGVCGSWIFVNPQAGALTSIVGLFVEHTFG